LTAELRAAVTIGSRPRPLKHVHIPPLLLSLQKSEAFFGATDLSNTPEAFSGFSKKKSNRTDGTRLTCAAWRAVTRAHSRKNLGSISSYASPINSSGVVHWKKKLSRYFFLKN
jgi:hypothetical protein